MIFTNCLRIVFVNEKLKNIFRGRFSSGGMFPRGGFSMFRDVSEVNFQGRIFKEVGFFRTPI